MKAMHPIHSEVDGGLKHIVHWSFLLSQKVWLHMYSVFCCKARATCIIKWNNGRLPFDPKIRNFRNGDKWYGNFLGKVPENLEIVEFPKSEPFNRKFWKFWDQSQMERKFAGNIFRKFGYTSRGCPLSLEAFLAYGWRAGNLNWPIRIQEAGKILMWS